MVMKTSGQKLAIFNSSHEWACLRKNSIRWNSVLKLLAPRQVLRLVHLLLVSHIYAEHLAAMIGDNYNPTDTILCLLQRHFRVLEISPDYAVKVTAIEKGKPAAWKALFKSMYQETLQPSPGGDTKPPQLIMEQDQVDPGRY